MVIAELLICILLLIYLCSRVNQAIQLFTSAASSLSSINHQLIAFIEGASHPEDPQFEDMNLDFVSQSHLQWWAMFGRRVYGTHSVWFYEQEKKAENEIRE